MSNTLPIALTDSWIDLNHNFILQNVDLYDHYAVCCVPLNVHRDILAVESLK